MLPVEILLKISYFDFTTYINMRKTCRRLANVPIEISRFVIKTSDLNKIQKLNIDMYCGLKYAWILPNGIPYCEDGPAILYDNGEIWFNNGTIHRNGDNPAIIKNNTKQWYKHGLIHRDNDRPAIECIDVSMWYQNNMLHRDDNKPAKIYHFLDIYERYQHGIFQCDV